MVRDECFEPSHIIAYAEYPEQRFFIRFADRDPESCDADFGWEDVFDFVDIDRVAPVYPDEDLLVDLTDEIIDRGSYHYFFFWSQMNSDVVGVAFQVYYFVEEYFPENIAVFYKYKILVAPGCDLFPPGAGAVPREIAERDFNGGKQFFFAERLYNVSMRFHLLCPVNRFRVTVGGQENKGDLV